MTEGRGRDALRSRLPTPAAERTLGLVAALLLGAWHALAGGLRFANSDSLLPVFAGLYRWTPFVWGESRFGMAVALLATPIRDPVNARLFHFVIGHALFVAFWILLAAYLLPGRARIAAGLATAAFAMAHLPPWRIAFYATNQAYVPSAAAGMAALLLLERGSVGRQLSGWLALAVSFWIAPTTLFWLLPLAYLRDAGVPGEPDDPTRRRFTVRRAAAGVALGMAVAGLGRFVPDVRQTPAALSSPLLWIDTWRTLANGLWDRVPGLGWLLAGIGAVCALRLVRRDRERSAARGPDLVVILVAAALASFLATGTLAWVAENAPRGTAGFRYVIPTHLLLLAAVPLGLWELLVSRRGPGGRAGAATVAAFLLFCVLLPIRFGAPSLERGRQSLAFVEGPRVHLDPVAHELLDRGATHLLGDYWKVYPIVLRANSIAYERGERKIVWPIADRSISARALWWRDDWRAARIAALRDDPWTESVRRQFELPELEVVERGERLDILRAGPGTLSAANRTP